MIKEKKITKKDLEARFKYAQKTIEELKEKVNNAHLIIEKGTEYNTVYFSDMGCGIYICKDFVVLSTNFHQHIWNLYTGSNYDMPSAFLCKLVDIANSHIAEIEDKNDRKELTYSFRKLKELTTLSEYEKTIVIMCEMYIYVINSPLYAIGSSKLNISMLQLNWNIFLSKGDFFLNNKIKDITLNTFYNDFISNVRYYSLNSEFDSDKLKDKVKKIENDAFNKIKTFIVNEGGVVKDDVLISEEAKNDKKDLEELQK